VHANENYEHVSTVGDLSSVLCGLRNYQARIQMLRSELIGVFPGLPPSAATDGLGYVWLRELLSPRRIPVDAFTRPGNRLGVLEPTVLRRVLAVRALFSCRTAVRRCIDRHALALMRDAVGATSLAQLQFADTVDGESALPLPQSLVATDLVSDGLQLIHSDGSVDDAGVWNLMTLQIQCGLQSVSDVFLSTRVEGERFLERVQALIPELRW
jgi:hypothetical protein